MSKRAVPGCGVGDVDPSEDLNGPDEPVVASLAEFLCLGVIFVAVLAGLTVFASTFP
jgi:hypothetical protein